jgi:predicted nucleotidyltransferase
MSNISIDISGKIEPGRVSVLRSIKETADELGISFFVVGAFARDVIFHHIHRITAPRVTEDIDLGVEVGSWEEFHRLTGTLVEREIVTSTKSPHRFVNDTYATIIDIVPYGGISGESKRISWPPEHEMIMSMLGVEEAYQTALKVHVSSEPTLDILVPSIPALACLKIISWADAYPARERDAQDLLFILENYEATGIEEQLYETHVDLLAEEGYDPRIASVRLLGRDIGQLCSPDTAKAVREILMRETDEKLGFRMLSHMVKGASFKGVRFEAVLKLLGKLLEGIQDGMPRSSEKH